MEKAAQAHFKPGLTTWILTSLVLGIVCGLFFGDLCTPLKAVGDIFIGLLQMTVLPYITLSLILNLGRISIKQTRNMAFTVIVLLLILWCIGLFSVALMSLSFPFWQKGAFFSTSIIEGPKTESLYDLFVPANPFFSLANNAVPAVVLFSIGVGIALSSIPRREHLLDPLSVAVSALMRLNRFVVHLSPFGVFAIVAYAVGTLPFEKFGLLQAYLITYSVATIMITVGILPMLLSICTPVRYWDAVRVSQPAVIAAFVLSSTFAVLPLIVEAARELLDRYELEKDETGGSPDVLVPLVFPFPDLGRIVGLIFIPFSAWFYGSSLMPEQYPKFLSLGMAGSFAKPAVTIPWLLDLMHIPHDIFQLYLAVGVYTTRLGDALRTVYLFSFAVLTAASLSGTLKVQWKRFFTYTFLSLCLAGVLIAGIHTVLEYTFKNLYQSKAMIADRQLLFPGGSETILKESAPNPDPIQDGETRIDRIRRRGSIRLGFDAKRLPFSYFNEQGELVGFDIDMAHRLALDLGVGIEFVPFTPQTLIKQLNEDHFDLAMSGLEGTIERATAFPVADSYMDVTLAIVLPDYRKVDFLEFEVLRHSPQLKIAVVANSFFDEKAHEFFPNASFVSINSEEDFFQEKAEGADIMVTSAEAGAAWTLLYPEFSVINPFKKNVRVPMYYLGAHDIEFEEFMEVWLELKKKEGVFDTLYNYWILGKDDAVSQPRWSIIRNVLHWVD
ncbi:cation:dicarboxylate symporter family transporter [Gimesia fumaroli]|uniref:Cyclohexadienyl dehydratase n=1 Tax=Gimesia fumaroli TaxID=2527976 RepID=A0A518IKN5_9PLAN|nr:cation:dicarboxylase symporter family transporter [Gimesia fumaroli]QDV53663.1 Cyclohexadienyl dehydratase precursor [Gimesia fumaroli]